MTDTKYFNPAPKTSEELKKAYRAMAIKNHPDKGGSEDVMKAINNEHEELFIKLKDIHTNKDGETYTAAKPTNETPNEFINIIEHLIRMEGITIEITGRFIWVSGNTKPYKELLKEMNFKWHSANVSWYLAPEDYKKRNKKSYSMDEIRNMYGSQEVETETNIKIA